VTKNVEIKSVCDVNPVKAQDQFTSEKELGYRPNFVKDMKAVFNDKVLMPLDFPTSRTLACTGLRVLAVKQEKMYLR